MITLKLPRFIKLRSGLRIIAAIALFWLIQAATSVWAIPVVDIAPIFIVPSATPFRLSSPATNIQVDAFNVTGGEALCRCNMSYTLGSLTEMSVSSEGGIFTVDETYGPGGSLTITTGTQNLLDPLSDPPFLPLYSTS